MCQKRSSTKINILKKQKEKLRRISSNISNETRKKMRENHANVSGKKNPFYGKHHSDRTKKILKENKSNEKNHNWKGDAVGLRSLHYWIRSRKHKPDFCEICNKKEPCDIANISGEYKRNVDDYQWLCRRCHIIKDGTIFNLVSMKNKKEESYVIEQVL